MKPWEQEWADDGVGRIKATDAITLEVRVAFWMVPGGDAEAARQADEVRKFAKAAPDMARALMALHANAVLFNRDSDAAWRELDTQVKDALREAGVIP